MFDQAWSVEQVAALAPDPQMARAGQQLAASRHWLRLARRDTALWGECQGSAAAPYRTTVDLAGPAFHCSCPSRKVPCKHALGLLLLYAAEPATLSQQDVPAWVAAWLANRRARQERATAERPPVRTERAAADQARRAQRREQRVQAGADQLQRWLHDLVRAGLVDLASRPAASFEQMAARLVDAQAPGLARQVRQLARLPHSGERWPERMLIELGRLQLLLAGYRRLDQLEPDLRAEVRRLVGFPEPREQVLAAPAVHDQWSVVGRQLLVEDRLRVQRTWLWGHDSRRWALLLEFAAAGQPLDQQPLPGTRVEGDACFYPGSLPLRAAFRAPPRPRGPAKTPPGGTVAQALNAYAAAVARNPWLEQFPLVLTGVPQREGQAAWWVVDAAGERLPITSQFGWQLLALSGGQPIDLFGEWDGHHLRPLAVASADGLLPLGAEQAA